MKTSLSMCRRERLTLRTVLESAGFLVFDISEGSRDRDRLRQLWAALILLDLEAPRMRGLEVVRSLRSVGGDSPEAIVATYGPTPEGLTAVQLGFAEVLAKPLTCEALRVAVEVILRPPAWSRPGPARPTIFVAVEPTVLDVLEAKRRWTAENSMKPSGSSAGPSIGTLARPWPITSWACSTCDWVSIMLHITPSGRP